MTVVCQNLRQLETIRTRVNTTFIDWWAALNQELRRASLPDALYGQARDCYQFGHSPETAAAEFEALS